MYLQERIPHKGEPEGSTECSKKRQRQGKTGALELQVHTLLPEANSCKCHPEAQENSTMLPRGYTKSGNPHERTLHQ